MSAPLSPELLAVLACPLDHAKLTLDAAKNTLACTACGRVYRIENGVPHFLKGV